MSVSDFDAYKRSNEDADTGFGMVPRYLRGRLTAYELAVYVALSWRCRSDGTCYMRHKRLAAESGCSVNSVKRALDGLRTKKVVTWKSMGDRSCNVYKLHVWRRGGLSQSEPSSTG